MVQNILVTGASGYLGGTVLARWKEAGLTGYDNLFALVRKSKDAEAVEELYGANPITFDVTDTNEVKEAITRHGITTVLFFLDAYNLTGQINFIQALAQVEKDTGEHVYFIYTTGAKQFSSQAGAPDDRPLFDNDPDIYRIHSSQRSEHQEMTDSIRTNTTVVEEGEKHGVRTFLLAPCIIYGKGEGFGNKISIQTTDIIMAAQALGRVYKVRGDRPQYPVCHVVDTAKFYLQLLKSILEGNQPDHSRNGIYLISAGNVIWDDLYKSIAKALLKRGVVRDDSIVLASGETRQQMAEALGIPASSVEAKISGNSTFVPAHGKAIGWAAEHPPEHAIEAMDDEVTNVLENMGGVGKGIR